MSNKEDKRLYFLPWIGTEYLNSTDRRLLLLGESHYIEEDDSDGFSTTRVIKNFIANAEMKTPFFKRIELLLNEGHGKEVWDQVAFANLIQNSFNNSKRQPGQEDIETIKPAFIYLVNYLKPKKVIVLSKRMWNFWLPSENWKHIQDITINDKKADVWKYSYEGGNCLAIGINHPSWMFGDQYTAWKPVIKAFLDL